MSRTVIAELWSGSVVVRRLRSVAEQSAYVDLLSDTAVTAELRGLGVVAIPIPAEQRARLKAWPIQVDLDAIATAQIAWNDGVRPVVRVLEEAFAGVGGGQRGVAGSLP